jgi:hypothetical protein
MKVCEELLCGSSIALICMDSFLCKSQPYGVAQVLSFVDIFITVQNTNNFDNETLASSIWLLRYCPFIDWQSLSLSQILLVKQLDRIWAILKDQISKKHFPFGFFGWIWDLLLASLDLRLLLQRTRLRAIVQSRTWSLQNSFPINPVSATWYTECTCLNPIIWSICETANELI